MTISPDQTGEFPAPDEVQSSDQHATIVVQNVDVSLLREQCEWLQVRIWPGKPRNGLIEMVEHMLDVADFVGPGRIDPRVHVVNVLDDPDGIYVFADEDQAREYAETRTDAVVTEAVYMSERSGAAFIAEVAGGDE